MIPKSGYRSSEKIILQQEAVPRRPAFRSRHPDCPQTAHGRQQFSRSAAENPLTFAAPGLGGRRAEPRRSRPMLYHAYQAHSDAMDWVRSFAGAALDALGQPPMGPVPAPSALRNLTATYELMARAGLTHERPPFGIDRVPVGNREVKVREVSECVTPFGTLLHFKKDIEASQPRVLLVAPLSGHFATLLRSTVRTMLPEH